MTRPPYAARTRSADGWGALCVALGLAAALGVPGCTFLVSDDPIRCLAEPGTPDPCPRDRVCVSGFCVPAPECDPSPELCNGLDDDCDATVDEGHDDDGDGFSWCGGGLPDEVDCDDTRDDVHPGSTNNARPAAPELCDSRDNDCDQRVDESPESLCDPGEQCFAGIGCTVPNCTLPGFECDPGDSCDVAVSPPECTTGVCTPGSCPSPQVCDATSGSCVNRLPLDSPCVVSAQCADGVCVPARALAGGSGSVCAKACCTDAECPAGRVCWASANGGRACVRPADIGSELGAGAEGESCSQSAECQSARCVDGRCRTACTSDDTCQSDAVCALQRSEDIAPAAVLACTPDSGGADIGEPCNTGSCASDMCVFRLEVLGSICLGGCRTSSDCPDDMYCGSARVDSGSGGSRATVQACVPRFHSGGAVTGESCSSGFSCRDFACVGDRCADTCCNDTQCPTDHACAPVSRGNNVYEMRCVPR